MAATNHAKGQQRPPAWAARGKLRLAFAPGGPAHAAASVLRGDWDCSPAGLLDACAYTPALVEKLVARRVNAVVLSWSLGFSDEGDQPQWNSVRALLPLLKKKKIRAIAQISLTDCFAEEFLRRVPQAVDWLARDEKGQPLARCGGRVLELSLASAGWRRYLIRKAREAVEAGCDGISLTGVPRLDRTDYAAEMRELWDAVRRASAARADELLLESRYGSGSFFFAGGALAPGLSSDGEFVSNIPAWKFFFEKGGRDKPFSAGMFEGALDEQQRRLSAAEIFACGGTCHDGRVPAAYQDFVAEHGPEFGGSDPINSVGVIPVAESYRLTGLVRRNIQHDLIPFHHYRNFEFRKYRVISAVQLGSRVEKSLAEQLKAFAQEHDGTVLALRSADPATADADEIVPRPNTPAAAMAEREEHTFGGGRVIVCRQTRSLEELACSPEVIADIEKYAGEPPIGVQAPDGVVALLWGKGTRRWVHVLNYRRDPAEAMISLPGCGGRKLTLLSPDDPPPQLRVMESGAGRAAFALADLRTYAVVEVS